MYGARACPACVYDAGVFVRRCEVHEYADAQRQRAEEAEARATLLELKLAEASQMIQALEKEVEHLTDQLLLKRVYITNLLDDLWRKNHDLEP